MLYTKQMDIIYSPSEFVDVFNQTIDYAYPRIVIEGELTNFKIAKNKWVYFDLKDDGASLRCFGTVYMLPGPLEDGMLVQIICTPRLHPQFNFSLQIQSITPKGEGALVKAAQLLYKKLETEGLFAAVRKRMLPFPPEKICLIASGESAAYADFNKILRTRWPYVEVDHIESQVQGEAAPGQLVDALKRANELGRYEVVVMVRGGGSADDLAAFSDERVVRAVASSRIPTLVAIGHEVDESLAELAADMRASTPSNAAELLVPDRQAVLSHIASDKTNIMNLLKSAVLNARRDVADARKGMVDSLKQLLTHERMLLAQSAHLLTAYDPKHVLKRGYALVKADNKIVNADVPAGTEVDIVFRNGERKAVMK